MSDTTSTTAITPKARLAFPSLFEARSYNGSVAKFSAVLVFDKEAQGTAEFQNLKKAAAAAARSKFGEKPPKQMRNPFRPGADKEGTAGFDDDCIFISVTSKKQPKVVDRRKVDGRFPVITDEDRLYPGCFVRCSVNAYAYDQSGNKGVAFGLNNVQFLDDGERIATGGGRNPDNEFDDAEGENVSEGKADDLF